MKIDKQYDIKRLGRVITLLEKINEIIYHMDDKEYDRFCSYIYKRYSINLPSTRATPSKEDK